MDSPSWVKVRRYFFYGGLNNDEAKMNVEYGRHLASARTDRMVLRSGSHPNQHHIHVYKYRSESALYSAVASYARAHWPWRQSKSSFMQITRAPQISTAGPSPAYTLREVGASNICWYRSLALNN